MSTGRSIDLTKLGPMPSRTELDAEIKRQRKELAAYKRMKRKRDAAERKAERDKRKRLHDAIDRAHRGNKAKGSIRVGAKQKKRKGNPAQESIEAYRDFHGEDPKEMVTVTTKVHFHRHLAAAGELKYLVVDTPDGKYRVTIKFKKDVLFAFNEKRNQLFVEGGDQAVKLEDFGIDPDDAHELETLGHASRIGYFTTKVHLRKEDGGTAVYDHKFRMTNENGQHVTVRVAKYPDVIYRVLDQHLEFSGGSYKILSEGIDQ